MCKGMHSLCTFCGDVGWLRWCSVYLELLANATALDIVLDKGSEARPPVMLPYRIVGVQFARVASHFVIVE